MESQDGTEIHLSGGRCHLGDLKVLIREGKGERRGQGTTPARNGDRDGAREDKLLQKWPRDAKRK